MNILQKSHSLSIKIFITKNFCSKLNEGVKLNNNKNNYVSKIKINYTDISNPKIKKAQTKALLKEKFNFRPH